MRVVIYDRTCKLTAAWALGAPLYRALGRVDASRGVASWEEALGWLAARPEPISELQYWGHGKWGGAQVGAQRLDAAALAPGHALRPGLEALREHLAAGALFWFRTCETFGARAGLDFAPRLADFLGARVAGHTHIIGFYQSGLHGLAPGQRPTWSPHDGLMDGSPDAPRRARRSSPWQPRTITCLRGNVPDAWFA